MANHSSVPDFARLDLRTRRMVYAFDLLHRDGRDLRALPLVERRQRLSIRSRVPYPRRVPAFDDGELLLAAPRSTPWRACNP